MNSKKFTIEVEMQERWIPYFMSMLEYMEYCGNIGMSRMVGLYADGDGDFRPKFKANIEWTTQEPIYNKDGNRYYDAG
jgi:hypothetical protein